MFNFSYEFMEKNISRFLKEGEKKEISSSIDPTVMAGFFIAFLLGLQLQLALIDRIDTGAYIEDIKKMLFTNVWNPLVTDIKIGSDEK